VALLNSHRPVFPLTFGGPEETDDWGVCDWCDQCHRKKGLTVWVDAFEPAGGLTGGEALVAAILGKIDAIEVTGEPRKVPLLPWVYRLWDAGFRVPLVGASGKESGKTPLGGMRTYTPRGMSWVESIHFRSGHCFASAGPLVTYVRDGDHLRASASAAGNPSIVEIVANGGAIAAGEGSVEAPLPPGWAAVRCPAQGGFAHTAPIGVGEVTRKPEAAAALRKLVEQTREWAETQGRYANPKRKQAFLDRCAEAAARLEGPP
jgi:hypothetical protein